MLKIPFGKHRDTGRLHDAGSVPNGLKCNCVCLNCGVELQAVHPTITNRQKYFRHHTNNCEGALETLFHKVAKQILKDHNELKMRDKQVFSYSHCDTEMPRYGKQPDAYLSNEQTSLIVEIYFSHRIEKETLNTFLNKGERILEIDISSQRLRVFDYDHLKQLVLYDAPRKMYSTYQFEVTEGASPGFDWKIVLGTIVGVFLFVWFLLQRPVKKRKGR